MKRIAKLLLVMIVVCVLVCTAVLCFGCGKKEEPQKHYQLSNPNATAEEQVQQTHYAMKRDSDLHAAEMIMLQKSLERR